MAGVHLHPRDAARFARLAQVAAGVLLAGAFAAYALLPVPTHVEAPAARTGQPAAGDSAPEAPEVDLRVTSERLATWDAKEAPPEAQDVTKTATTTPPTLEGKEWKYLGAIVEPTRLVAIVSEGGSQHYIVAGSTLDGSEVVQVRADAIVVKEGGAQRTIELTPRTGAVVGTAVSPSEPGEANDSQRDGESGVMDPRTMERRIPNSGRPGVPGAKNIPRPPRPMPGPAGANPSHPMRPRAPEGS